VGIGNTTLAAAMAASLLGLPVEDAVGLGAGGDSATLSRKRAVVEAALARVAREHADDTDDPVAILAALGGPEVAYLTGVVRGAAAAGSLLVIDGLVTATAALAAVALEPAVGAHLVAGQESREQAHHAVNTSLGLEPLLSLRLRSGEGVGALLALQLLVTATAVRAGAGRVTEPEA
jgi:nicotinate-nucleotide--dimethylbenzimidazole phosphoribosyltransferase